MSNPWAKPLPAQAVIKIPEMTLQRALASWETAKEALEDAKADELKWRKIAFDLGFESAKEGTNIRKLANDYELKGVKKFNYKLQKPENFTGTKVEAVDAVIDSFSQLSNEGAFIADRLFKWDVDLSISEYRTLVEDAKDSVSKKAMLTQLEKILIITEATPTLEIKAPGGKK